MSSPCGPGGSRSRAAAAEKASAPYLANAATATAAATLTDWSRSRTVRAPRGLFVAVRTGDGGAVAEVAGPFGDEDDARSHLAEAFDGHGCTAPFTVTLRSPPRPP
jgi:hypothetical protein